MAHRSIRRSVAGTDALSARGLVAPQGCRTMSVRLLRPRILLIEATSSGSAIGFRRKGMTDGIAGICLDNDLEMQPMTTVVLRLSGSDLMVALVGSVPRAVLVLIHCMNTEKPPAVERSQRDAGFSALRIHMAALDNANFDGWMGEARSAWEFTSVD